MTAGAAVGPVRPFIPIPRLGGRPAKYPLRTMCVASSFIAHCREDQSIDQLANSLTSCISSIERKTGRKFTMRREARKITVWRTR